MRILSLALNMPGPAALMRCQQMGARCVKVEPPGGDPMLSYCKPAYAAMHAGIRITTTDLKTEAGQKKLHKELAKTDVLLTSFRPSALTKLGLKWKALHKQYPQLSQVVVVGSPGALAEQPGHEASEAVLQATLYHASQGKGVCIEDALSSAANLV